MSSLDRGLVEHRLSLKPGKKPVKQHPQRFASEVIEEIKAEIQRLLEAKFIRTARYVQWISNIVHVVKKNGPVRVCINSRNSNAATPKDKYHMPVADMLVDSGYNQIYIIEEDVSKTTFRCLGSIGTFEWVMAHK